MMRDRIQFFRVPALLLLMVFSISTLSAQNTFQQPTAMEILNTTGLKGGLIVHLGCGKGELTAALHINDRYLVHGLGPVRQSISLQT